MNLLIVRAKCVVAFSSIFFKKIEVWSGSSNTSKTFICLHFDYLDLTFLLYFVKAYLPNARSIHMNSFNCPPFLKDFLQEKDAHIIIAFSEKSN